MGYFNLVFLCVKGDILMFACSSDMYEVLEYSPRISIHANLITADEVKKWLPKGAPKNCDHLIVMALMEKNVTHILSCASE